MTTEKPTTRSTDILFFNSLTGKFYKTLLRIDSSGLAIGEVELTSEVVDNPVLVKPVMVRISRK